MSGENTLDYKFYILKKEWLKQVESLLIEQIPFIKDVFQRTEKQGTQEYCDGNCKAEIIDSSLIIVTQNFRFIVTDDHYEFSIKYRILDEYTKQNSRKMLGIDPKGDLLHISKIVESDPLCYVDSENYFIFESFIREIECLDVVLKEGE